MNWNKNILYKKVSKIKNFEDEIVIIYLYRYFSLVISTIFYLIENIGNYHRLKFIGVICLLVASVLINNLYIENRNNKISIILLVIIDILGNIVILIPTGGLSSPYIWYSFSTILIAINYLNIYYCMMLQI